MAKTCEVCQEKFYFVSRLVAHLRVAHGIQRPFECDTCGKSYPQQFMLNAHVKRSHMPKTMPCNECGFMGVSAVDVERHRKRHHSGRKPPPASENKKRPEHKCDVCNKVYKFKSILRRHQENAHGDRSNEMPRYLCAVCGKKLKTAKGLDIHNRSHTGEKPYTCEVCGKSFKCEALLRTHRVIHTGERNYSCDQCGKTFTQRSTLVVHKRYHSGERPYVCPRCNKGFVTRTVLNSHMTSCHSGGSLARPMDSTPAKRCDDEDVV